MTEAESDKWTGLDGVGKKMAGKDDRKEVREAGRQQKERCVGCMLKDRRMKHNGTVQSKSIER